MRRINYPKDKNTLEKFKNAYYNYLDKSEINEINEHLNKIQFKSKDLTFEKLVVLSFEELIEIEPIIKSYSNNLDAYDIYTKRRTNEFEDLFDYSSNQPKIAQFFMHQDCLNLTVCHYCGIDHINAFTDLNDYSDSIDFINRADDQDLQIIKGIGKSYAQRIIDKRNLKLFVSIDEIGLTKSIRNQIDAFDFKKGHNHFTLDHVIPQKTHKFFSLCLFNFVPSCYSCNSKFKKAIDFDLDNDIKKISPTSESYSFTEDFEFDLFYASSLNSIKTNSDFVIKKTILGNKNHIEKYLSMFKIGGRYTFHKTIILDLIEKKIKYPDSRIKQFSKKFGKPQIEIRKDLFGAELFDNSKSDLPMVKFKRDIAKKLKIKGVI